MASTTNEVDRSRKGASASADRLGNLARMTSLVGSPIMTLFSLALSLLMFGPVYVIAAGPRKLARERSP
jgi:hypothetical protein